MYNVEYDCGPGWSENGFKCVQWLNYSICQSLRKAVITALYCIEDDNDATVVRVTGKDGKVYLVIPKNQW